MWWSTAWFGLREFTFRLPALGGAALFLWFLPDLVERTVPGRWLRLPVFLILTLNPLTLDLLCVARGYSLALGFFVLALIRLSRYGARQQPRDLSAMSLFLGLTCCANLSFAFVAIATLLVGLWIALRNGGADPSAWREAILRALAPGLAILFCILVLPLSRAERHSFYWGSPSIRESVHTTATPFLQHNSFAPGPLGTPKTMGRFERRFLPAALLIMLAVGLYWFLNGRHPQATLLLGVLTLALFGYWLAHEWLGSPYPSERTGVAVALLYFLCLGAVASAWRPSFRGGPAGFWAVSVPVALVFAAMLVQFAQQLEPGYLWAWQEERDNEQIAGLLRERGAKRICAYWVFQPAMDWYRRAGRIPGAEPLAKYQGENPPLEGHDAYVLVKPDPSKLAAKGLRAVWRNPLTGVVLAVPSAGTP